MTSRRRSRPCGAQRLGAFQTRAQSTGSASARDRIVALVAHDLDAGAASAARSRGSAGSSRRLAPDGFSPSSGLSHGARSSTVESSAPQRTMRRLIAQIAAIAQVSAATRRLSRAKSINCVATDRIFTVPGRERRVEALGEGGDRLRRVGRSSSKSGRSVRKTITTLLPKLGVDGEGGSSGVRLALGGAVGDPDPPHPALRPRRASRARARAGLRFGSRLIDAAAHVGDRRPRDSPRSASAGTRTSITGLSPTA